MTPDVHRHEWKAVNIRMNEYRCATCGAEGYRFGTSFLARKRPKWRVK